MPQATLDGVTDHPLADADRVKSIESDPVTWIHHEGDIRPCDQCGGQMHLYEGGYIVATLTIDRRRYRDKSLVRVCSEGCYRSWAKAFQDSGW